MNPAPRNPDGTICNFDPDGNLMRSALPGELMCLACRWNRWSAWCSYKGGRFERLAHPGNYAGDCKHFEEAPR